MPSSAKSLVVECTPSVMSSIYNKKSIGPKTVPCGTPTITNAELDVGPFTTTCWLRFPRCSDPVVSVVGYAIVPDLMEELGMRDFVKGLAEIKHDGICLVFLIDGLGPVVNAADELSLA